MERVERTNVVMIYLQQKEGVAQRNPYVMEVNRGRNVRRSSRLRMKVHGVGSDMHRV